MTIRKLTAVLASTALMATAGAGIARAQSDSTSGSSKTTTQQPTKKKGKRGRRGPSNAQLSALAETLGVTTAQLKTAFNAIRPAKGATKPDPRAGFAEDIATALGVETPAVQEILDANRPAKGTARPAPGTKPDHTALIAALASGLNLDEAAVTAAFEKLDAAHEAEHASREAEMAKALAAELGLDVDKVTAALEATRPARP